MKNPAKETDPQSGYSSGGILQRTNNRFVKDYFL